MQLKGRKALITGAQQGIGRSIAIAFAREGADVAINYLDNADAAREVAREAEAFGGKAVPVHADVSEFSQLSPLVDKADAALGGIDILVNNAGIYPRAHILDLTEFDMGFHARGQSESRVLSQPGGGAPAGGCEEGWRDHQSFIGCGAGLA